MAIIPRSSEIHHQRLDILQELTKAGFSNVDMVFLDTYDIVLKYEAIRQNKLFYHTPDFDRGATYSLIVRQYLDFLPYLKTQRQAYKRRILNDKTRNKTRRLHKLDEYLTILNKLRRYSYDDFISDPEHTMAVLSVFFNWRWKLLQT